MTYDRESGGNSNSDDKSGSSSENDSNSFMNLTSDKNEKTENNSFLLNNSSYGNVKDSLLESIDMSVLDSNFDSKKDFLPSNLSRTFNNMSKDNIGNKYLNKLLNKKKDTITNENNNINHNNNNNNLTANNITNNLINNNMNSPSIMNTNKKENFLDAANLINDDSGLNNLKKFSTVNNVNDTYEKKIIETELSDASDFENMVGDLRITFINWLKKTQMNFIREKDKLFKDKKELEMERVRLYKELENRKNIEEQKLHDERKKLDIDISNGYK